MSVRKDSDRLEKTIAKRLGGQRVPGSGSTRTRKQDVRFEGALMQVKSTSKESIGIKLADLRQLVTDSMNADKAPIFLITFTGPGTHNDEWVCLPLWWIEGQVWWNEKLSRR